MGGLTVILAPGNRPAEVTVEESPGGFQLRRLAAGGAILAVQHEENEVAKTAKKAAAKAADKKTAKAKPGPKGPRNDYAGKKIKLLVKDNPRRKGTRAYEVYDRYKDGMTVEAFFKAGGGSGDIRWDLERKHIQLV